MYILTFLIFLIMKSLVYCQILLKEIVNIATLLRKELLHRSAWCRVLQYYMTFFHMMTISWNMWGIPLKLIPYLFLNDQHLQVLTLFTIVSFVFTLSFSPGTCFNSWIRFFRETEPNFTKPKTALTFMNLSWAIEKFSGNLESLFSLIFIVKMIHSWAQHQMITGFYQSQLKISQFLSFLAEMYMQAVCRKKKLSSVA